MYHRIFFITSDATAGTPVGKANRDDIERGLPSSFSLRTERIPGGESEATIHNNLVYVSWQTTAEMNTSHFELQRSENSHDFETIKTIAACGTSKTTSRYATTDSNYIFFYEKLYYRLKLVFINGRESFTDVITLDINTLVPASVHDLTYNRNIQ